MPSLLFVDDEPNVLSGLRRMLRCHAGDWSMDFCDSGEAALKRLADQPADVVVSDMRMPGMDGAQLLSNVRALYPEAIRIVLSGHSDQELTLRAVGPAHQYLAKPCRPERLTQVIQSALALHSRVRSDGVRRAVAGLDMLPTIPEVYVDLVAEVSSPGGSVEAAGKIIARDLGMSAKILQLVNSSFFGLPVRVSDVPHAVALLGLGVIRPLVLSTGVFGQFSSNELGGISLGKLTDHSTRTAVRAREIAAESLGLSEGDVSNAFLGALMHDVGRLVLAQAIPEEYSRICREFAEAPARIATTERELFGASHADVGAYLLQMWGLPAPLVETVAFHHRPSESTGDPHGVLTAVHAAEVLTDQEAEWDQSYLENNNLTHHVDAWASDPEAAEGLVAG